MKEEWLNDKSTSDLERLLNLHPPKLEAAMRDRLLIASGHACGRRSAKRELWLGCIGGSVATALASCLLWLVVASPTTKTPTDLNRSVPEQYAQNEPDHSSVANGAGTRSAETASPNTKPSSQRKWPDDFMPNKSERSNTLTVAHGSRVALEEYPVSTLTPSSLSSDTDESKPHSPPLLRAWQRDGWQ